MKALWLTTALAMAAIPAIAQSPSLAEIARKSRAAHEKKGGGKVITDDDIQRAPSTETSSGTAKGTAATATSGGSSGPETAAPADRQEGQGKPQQPSKADSKPGQPPKEDDVERLKKELDDLKAQQEGWKTSASRYEQKLADERDEFRRTMYQDALDNDRANAAKYQRKIDETQEKLAGAEAAASKSSSPPQ